jgi:hypothetical protein
VIRVRGFISRTELGPLTLMALEFSATVLGWLAFRWHQLRQSSSTTAPTRSWCAVR